MPRRSRFFPSRYARFVRVMRRLDVALAAFEARRTALRREMDRLENDERRGPLGDPTLQRAEYLFAGDTTLQRDMAYLLAAFAYQEALQLREQARIHKEAHMRILDGGDG